jgi:hypothetical protein
MIGESERTEKGMGVCPEKEYTGVVWGHCQAFNSQQGKGRTVLAVLD